MDEKEKTHKKSINDIEEHGAAEKESKWTHGDELLEREFLRQQRARDIVDNEKLDLTKDGKALYMHPLPADISGISCKEGEVASDIFERYRIDTYKEAGWKPYIIAAVMFCNRFKIRKDR